MSKFRKGQPQPKKKEAIGYYDGFGGKALLFASYSTFNVIKWFDMDKKKSTQKN